MLGIESLGLIEGIVGFLCNPRARILTPNSRKCPERSSWAPLGESQPLTDSGKSADGANDRNIVKE